MVRKTEEETIKNTTTEEETTTEEKDDDIELGGELQDYADKLITLLVDNRSMTYIEAHAIFTMAAQLCMDELLNTNSLEDEKDISKDDDEDLNDKTTEISN